MTESSPVEEVVACEIRRRSTRRSPDTPAAPRGQDIEDEDMADKDVRDKDVRDKDVRDRSEQELTGCAL